MGDVWLTSFCPFRSEPERYERSVYIRRRAERLRGRTSIRAGRARRSDCGTGTRLGGTAVGPKSGSIGGESDARFAPGACLITAAAEIRGATAIRTSSHTSSAKTSGYWASTSISENICRHAFIESGSLPRTNDAFGHRAELFESRIHCPGWRIKGRLGRNHPQVCALADTLGICKR